LNTIEYHKNVINYRLWTNKIFPNIPRKRTRTTTSLFVTGITSPQRFQT